MDHGYFRDRISAYLDKELPPYEEQAVGEHLKECAECRELLSKLEKMDELVAQHSQLGEEDYWEQAAQRIEQQLENPQPEEKIATPSRWRGLGWKLIAAAASIAVITFIGLHKSEISTEPPASIKQESPAVSTRKPEPVSPMVVDSELSVMDKGKYPEEETIKETASTRSEKTSQSETSVRKNTKPKIKITGQQTTAKKNMEKEPVTNVDDLIEKVGRVATDRSGDIYIRGGRAGEVSHIVDSTTSKNQEEISHDDNEPRKKDGKDFVIQAQGLKENRLNPVVENKDKKTSGEIAETLKKAITQNQSVSESKVRVRGSIDKLTFPSSTSDSVGSELTNWLTRRDSLQILWDSLQDEESKLTLKKTSPKKSLSSIDTVEMQLLESYYNVAIYAHKWDPQESDDAIKFFEQYLKRNDIRHRAAARNYLQRLKVELK